jgi:hypothetical protein
LEDRGRHSVTWVGGTLVDVDWAASDSGSRGIDVVGEPRRAGKERGRRKERRAVVTEVTARAIAQISVDNISAGSVVLAWGALALIDVHVAVSTEPSIRTLAFVPAAAICTFTPVRARQQGTLVHLFRAC